MVTGRSPLDWSVSDWVGIGVSSTVSLGTVPVIRAHGLDPDHLGVTVGSGAMGNALGTTVASNLQGDVPGVDDIGAPPGGDRDDGKDEAERGKERVPRRRPTERPRAGPVR